MTQQSSLKRPFTGGLVTDVPGHDLGPSLSTYAQDGFSPQGVFKQRQGWAYDGTNQVAAANGIGLHRGQYVLADVTRTMAVLTPGSVYVHNPSAGGTLVFSGGNAILPRCVYRDELILCYQDGVTPLRRYSGAALASSTSATATSVATGKATLTATSGTWAASVVPGAYVSLYANAFDDPFPPIFFRVVERISSTVITLEDFQSSAGTNVDHTATGTGVTFPCVNVYGAGTGSFDAANDEFDGTGTVWTGGTWGSVVAAQDGDGLLTIPVGSNAMVNHIWSVTNATTLDLRNSSRTATDTSYAITRRCPFKDAASHKGSLWGTGVAQYPSRVYVAPPGWNPSFPPGFVTPFVGSTALNSPNANDFLMDFIDVPSSYDGDDNIAILSSPNPLLVLKRTAVYGIYGSYPNFSVDMLADGIGCIDIRSAHSYDEGQFWAGEGGIYWYAGGQVRDLTAGRINREWRALTRDFDYGTSDYCSLGVTQGHLVVHITTGAGTTQRTYLCDLRDGSWQSRISNFTPRYMFTSRIPGEKEKLLAVSDARQGRVIDFAPALDGSGTAKDDAGSAPRLQAHTPEGIGGDISGDTRMLDLAVHANVYDAGVAGSTSMTVSVVSQDALTDDASTATLADIDSDTTDRLDRHYFRRVDRRGRRHQVRLAVDTLGTDSNATKVEVHQIDATFRESRRRT